MAVAFEIETYQTQIEQIVGDVFRTMLNAEAVPSAASRPQAGSLTSTVQFAGDWKGAVLLQCDARPALEMATRLLPGPAPSKVDENVRDALGELANMIGGNLKSVLPPGVALSMPSVVDGSDYALHLCGGNASKTLPFASEVGDFSVTLVRVIEKR